MTNHLPFDEARQRLRSLIRQIDRSETVELGGLDGRVLAEPLCSPRAVPHFPRAAMDGWAVRSSDTAGASPGDPAQLLEAEGHVDAGTATYVDTGGQLPPGADAIARIETVETDNGRVHVRTPIPPGKDVSPVGEDLEANQPLYQPGHVFRPPDLGVLKSAGIGEVSVRERPCVAIVPTGSEIVDSDPEPGQAVETNGLMVSSYVARWGGLPERWSIVPDDRDLLRRAFERASTEADVLVTTGGSSVGRRDLVPEIVAENGEVSVHHVAIKPGHPVALGRFGDTPAVMLPGYPVSCVLNAVQFLRPAVYWRQGRTPPPMPSVEAELDAPIRSSTGMTQFERIRLDLSDGHPHATPVGHLGAAALSSVGLSDGWVVVDDHTGSVSPGTTVTVELWDTTG